MKRLLTLLAFLLIFGAFAAAQTTKVPVCNGFNTVVLQSTRLQARQSALTTSASQTGPIVLFPQARSRASL